MRSFKCLQLQVGKRKRTSYAENRKDNVILFQGISYVLSVQLRSFWRVRNSFFSSEGIHLNTWGNMSYAPINVLPQQQHFKIKISEKIRRFDLAEIIFK